MKTYSARSVAALATVVALGVGIPTAAFGDTTTTTVATTTLTIKAPTPWTTFRAAWTTYVNGLKTINASYRATVKTARTTFAAAIKAAKTKAERQAARAALTASLIGALNVRVAAITAAGDPPSPPTGYNATAYVQGLQAANIARRAAVDTAQAALATALASATTPFQRHAARLAYTAAVDTANATRANALIALGAPPKHPGKPIG